MAKGRGSFRKSLPGVSVESWTSLRFMMVALNFLSSLFRHIDLIFHLMVGLCMELISICTQHI